MSKTIPVVAALYVFNENQKLFLRKIRSNQFGESIHAPLSSKIIGEYNTENPELALNKICGKYKFSVDSTRVKFFKKKIDHVVFLFFYLQISKRSKLLVLLENICETFNTKKIEKYTGKLPSDNDKHIARTTEGFLQGTKFITEAKNLKQA